MKRKNASQTPPPPLPRRDPGATNPPTPKPQGFQVFKGGKK
ncbi:MULTISPECIES: hypothetical protein [Streptomyces]|uniref:Uncharacterized protein n=1 Tax=Streptomyces yatensis TaxID=155177 RepID=A0ABP4VDG0_9ACTN|nr:MULTISPECIES: hypothetical protein [Streptomyces]